MKRKQAEPGVTTQTERQLALSLFDEGFRTAVALRGRTPREMPQDQHWNAGWEAGLDVYTAAIRHYGWLLTRGRK